MNPLHEDRSHLPLEIQRNLEKEEIRREEYLKKLKENEAWEQPYLKCLKCGKEIEKTACYWAAYLMPPRCLGEVEHRGAFPTDVRCIDCSAEKEF